MTESAAIVIDKKSQRVYNFSIPEQDQRPYQWPRINVDSCQPFIYPYPAMSKQSEGISAPELVITVHHNPRQILSRQGGTYFTQHTIPILSREHIRNKPTSLCKLWKLQSGPSYQHPRGGAQRGGTGDLQKCDYPIQGRVQIVKLPNPPYPLDVDPMAQIEVSIVCTERLVCT